MESLLVQTIKVGNTSVLSSADLAYALGTNSKTLVRNFQRNRDRYIENVHFYILDGDKLKDFKQQHNMNERLKYVSLYYLWTKDGACLHAKSINTDRAWQAFHTLFQAYTPEDNTTLHSGEQTRLRKAVAERVGILCKQNAKDKASYFSEIHRAIRARFNVESYRDVLQTDLQTAIRFVETWGGEEIEER